jgi:hypothetical protein
MSIFESRETHKDSVISTIGKTFVDVISVPFDFTAKVVKTPFDFVGNTVSGVTTKVVLIAGLAILGVYIIGKFNIIGQVGKLK